MIQYEGVVLDVDGLSVGDSVAIGQSISPTTATEGVVIVGTLFYRFAPGVTTFSALDLDLANYVPVGCYTDGGFPETLNHFSRVGFAAATAGVSGTGGTYVWTMTTPFIYLRRRIVPTTEIVISYNPSGAGADPGTGTIGMTLFLFTGADTFSLNKALNLGHDSWGQAGYPSSPVTADATDRYVLAAALSAEYTAIHAYDGPATCLGVGCPGHPVDTSTSALQAWATGEPFTPSEFIRWRDLSAPAAIGGLKSYTYVDVVTPSGTYVQTWDFNTVPANAYSCTALGWVGPTHMNYGGGFGGPSLAGGTEFGFTVRDGVGQSCQSVPGPIVLDGSFDPTGIPGATPALDPDTLHFFGRHTET